MKISEKCLLTENKQEIGEEAEINANTHDFKSSSSHPSYASPRASKRVRRIQNICPIHNAAVWECRMMKADYSQALKRQLLRIEAEKGMVAKPKRDDVSWPRWSRFVVLGWMEKLESAEKNKHIMKIKWASVVLVNKMYPPLCPNLGSNA